jgi:hypothetical protein
MATLVASPESESAPTAAPPPFAAAGPSGSGSASANKAFDVVEAYKRALRDDNVGLCALSTTALCRADPA